MKKQHSRSNLIGFCRELMRLQHRRSSIFFLLFLLTLICTSSLFAIYFLRVSYIFGVQITVSKYSSHCEQVHIASVVGGETNSRYYSTFLKSILSKTQSPLHLHLITDRKSHQILKKLFSTWGLPSVTVSFYDMEPYLSRVDWIPNAHYSGNYGLMKLLIPEILGSEIEKVIVMDTDTLVLTDIIELWSHLNFMASHEFLGMADNLSGWYTQNVTGPKWPALGNGFNSGVILMNLKGLRRSHFAHLWREVTNDYLQLTSRIILADQDIFNAVIVTQPEIVYPIPFEYNLQVGLKSTLSQQHIHNARIIHWNNKNKSLESYPELLKLKGSFEDMVGDVFILTRFICTPELPYAVKKESTDECDSYKPLSSYRTHLFLLPYTRTNNSKITLISHLSTDRLSMLDSLLSSWKGDISVAIYGSDKEINAVVKFVNLKYSQRTNIALHGVYAQGGVFPINYLRNVALNSCETEFVFIIDADFTVYQENEIVSALETLAARTVLVIPAFEYVENSYEDTSLSLNKNAIVELLSVQKVIPFRTNIWPKGHKATQFTTWSNATSPFQIEWESDFEPYIVGRKREVPQFDERFGGFGWNKVTQAYQMKIQRLDFFVHPTAFVIHRHHPPSNELVKYRYSALYRKCLLRLKRDFVSDLLWTYNGKQMA